MPPVGYEAFVDEGLGNSSYLVDVGQGQAIVVDPDRRASRYLQRAEAKELHIVAVLETHLHADFITGALEVRAATGATIYAPSEGGVAYAHRGLRAGERVEVGDLEVEVRATPGHTPEHLSFVLRDGAAPPMLFSGGALIVGGAARTDLVSPGLTEALTRSLYATRRAFDDLADETLVLPTHGAGSFCSAGSGSARTSTLGAERKGNPVLSFGGDEDAFVQWFPKTFPGTPAYYSRMRPANAAGPRLASQIALPPALQPAGFAEAMRQPDALVVDTRAPDAYAVAHIEGALAVPFRAAFPIWLGWLAPVDARLLLVLDGHSLQEVVQGCLLVGYEDFIGVLEGGLETWVKQRLPVRSLPTIGPEDALPWLEMGAAPLDVREPDEFAMGHLAGATSIPLGALEEAIPDIPSARPVLTYCSAGVRSVSGASVLERAGVGPVVNLRGGYGAWRQAGRD
jgi:glyoxylase-like metal-dependent hydrolase (beta-lactamase superfamily II)/rhodanese-related sulfurtransferase